MRLGGAWLSSGRRWVGCVGGGGARVRYGVGGGECGGGGVLGGGVGREGAGFMPMEVGGGGGGERDKGKEKGMSSSSSEWRMDMESSRIFSNVEDGMFAPTVKEVGVCVCLYHQIGEHFLELQ